MELKSHLNRAQAQMKIRVDSHRRDITFELRDSVFEAATVQKTFIGPFHK